MGIRVFKGMNLSGYFLSVGNDVNDHKNWTTFILKGIRIPLLF